MELEEQVKAYKAIVHKIDELEAEKKALAGLILQQLDGTISQKIAGFTVRRCQRFMIKLSIEEARVFGAVKMEECVDKGKIKELYQKGEPVTGVSIMEYLQVFIPSIKETV